MHKRTSALCHTVADPSGIRVCAPVTMGEITDWTLVQVAAFPSDTIDFERIILAEFGIAPPENVGQVAVVKDLKVFKTGRDQYWFLSPERGLASRLGNRIGVDIGTVIALSHSRSRMYIEGKDTLQVLSQRIPLDLDPEVFQVECFALTGVHHVPILLYRSAMMRYELLVLRTYARFVWEWLADAALPWLVRQ